MYSAPIFKNIIKNKTDYFISGFISMVFVGNISHVFIFWKTIIHPNEIISLPKWKIPVKTADLVSAHTTATSFARGQKEILIKISRSKASIDIDYYLMLCFSTSIIWYIHYRQEWKDALLDYWFPSQRVQLSIRSQSFIK